MFKDCKDGNTTYQIGDAFVKDDCSEICECFAYSIYDSDDEEEDDYDDEEICIESHIYEKSNEKSKIICSELCAAGSTCPVGLVEGTSCLCNRSRCEKRK